jgi:hypothetical protein
MKPGQIMGVAHATDAFTVLNQGAAFGAISSISPTNNESLDMNNWDNHEFRKFLQWFIEANHPEVIEQYQAVRAIERKIEQEEANRRYREQLEAEMQLRQRVQAQRAQQAYPYSQSPYATTATQSLSTAEPKPKTLWECAKQLAGYK